jgi:hypothetical protein
MRYVVTTPWGTFKRTSTRAYRFLVTTCGEAEDRIRARYGREIAHCERQRDRYQRGIAAGAIPSDAFPHDDVAKYPAYLASTERRLMVLPVRLAEALAENAARIAERRGRYFAWASRRDLADAQYRRALKAGFVNVHVYSCADEEPYTASQEVA